MPHEPILIDLHRRSSGEGSILLADDLMIFHLGVLKSDRSCNAKQNGKLSLKRVMDLKPFK